MSYSLNSLQRGLYRGLCRVWGLGSELLKEDYIRFRVTGLNSLKGIIVFRVQGLNSLERLLKGIM